MRERVTINDAQEMLSELLDELPKAFFQDLSGGVQLLEEHKLHAESGDVPLYVMGEYRTQRGMGASIVIYFGSFDKIYGYTGRSRYKRALRRVLRHEFRHHVEALAGSKDLILEDKKNIAEYKRRYKDEDKD